MRSVSPAALMEAISARDAARHSRRPVKERVRRRARARRDSSAVLARREPVARARALRRPISRSSSIAATALARTSRARRCRAAGSRTVDVSRGTHEEVEGAWDCRSSWRCFSLVALLRSSRSSPTSAWWRSKARARSTGRCGAVLRGRGWRAAAIPTAGRRLKTLLWKTPVPGRGNSSPIVWGDRIFLTTAYEGGRRVSLIAFRRSDGAQLWETFAPEGRTGRAHQKNGHASATASTDGTLVYASFGSRGLAAFDFSGKLVWHQDLGDRRQLPRRGGIAAALQEPRHPLSGFRRRLVRRGVRRARPASRCGRRREAHPSDGEHLSPCGSERATRSS